MPPSSEARVRVVQTQFDSRAAPTGASHLRFALQSWQEGSAAKLHINRFVERISYGDGLPRHIALCRGPIRLAQRNKTERTVEFRERWLIIMAKLLTSECNLRCPRDWGSWR